MASRPGTRMTVSRPGRTGRRSTPIRWWTRWPGDRALGQTTAQYDPRGLPHLNARPWPHPWGEVAVGRLSLRSPLGGNARLGTQVAVAP